MGLPNKFGHRWVDTSPSQDTGSWIVSYADLMAILLTFFVLLLSVSRVTQTKFDFLVEAFTGKKVGNLRLVKEHVDEVIEFSGLGGEIHTELDDDGLKIEFANAVLFDSGSAELTSGAKEVFAPIATHLISSLESAYGITIEGYTDDVPIATERFRSNWELSASRAIHLMQRLQNEGFDGQRMSIQGFADTRAAANIDLLNPRDVAEASAEQMSEARSANRRVVLRIDHMDKKQRQRIQLNHETLSLARIGVDAASQAADSGDTERRANAKTSRKETARP